MRPITLSLSLAAAVANSIALLQTTAGAGSLTLNGALASGGVATIPIPSQVTLTSTGNISGVNFTITGTNYRGQAISEVLAGPNNNTVTSVYTYATVTSITVNGAVGTNTSVGNGQSGSSPVVPLDLYLTPFNVSLWAIATGTISYDVQYTEDDVFATSYNPETGNWVSLQGMDDATTSQQTILVSPVTAVRSLQNSGTGSLALRILQAGIQ